MLIPKNSNKLDDKIKESLTNFMPPYNEADWLKMESKLNALPKSSNYKWRYFVNGILAIGILGGGYFLFNVFKSNNTNINTIDPAPSTSNIINPDAKVVNPTKTTNISIGSSLPNNAKQTEAIAIKEKPLSEPPKMNAMKLKGANEEKQKENFIKPQQIILMGNEPIFGDMLDSSKGLIGETKENAETRKAAIIQSDEKIGWDIFLTDHIKVDSLNKNKEKISIDSLKTPNK